MAIMTIQNQMENVGQSVALNVIVYEEIIPIAMDVGPALARRQERCADYRHSQQPTAGIVRFPHDPFTEGQIVGPSMMDIHKVIDAAQKDPGRSTGEKVGFVLVGCVSYRSSFEPENAPSAMSIKQ